MNALASTSPEKNHPAKTGNIGMAVSGQHEPAHPASSIHHRASLFVSTVIAATLGSLWIRTGFPAEVWAGAGADDLLFVRLARSLISGHWLGHFDELTLVKGVGYPSFIALSFALGVPLKVAETSVYLVVCGVSTFCVSRWARSYVVGSVLFVFLAFNPALLSESMSRVVRENFYLTLSLTALVLPLIQINRYHHLERRSVLLAVVTGVA